MRNPNRIDICLKLFWRPSILYNFIGKIDQDIKIKVYTNWKLIESVWKENPDLRFGQLLSNLNLVDKDTENKIWNVEEIKWLIDNNYVHKKNYNIMS